jgi:CTP-dependent riboflavin kinase
MAKSQEKLIYHNGVTDSLSGWSKRTGMSKQTIHSRLKRLPKEEALKKTFKERKRSEPISIDEKSLLKSLIHERADYLGVDSLLSEKESETLKRIKERREQKWK